MDTRRGGHMQLTEQQLRGFYRQDYVDRHSEAVDRRLARLLPHIEFHPDDHVLDCACGSGQLLELIHDRAAHYVGVDFSDEFIQKGLERRAELGITNAEFICSDLADFCRAHPQQFDKCFAFDFSEHIYDDDFVRIFRAVHACLKDNGCLYLHTPNADYFLERLKSIGLLQSDPTHIAVRNAAGMCQLLSDAGFQPPKVEYLAHYVKSLERLHFMARIPWVGRLFRARLFVRCSKGGTVIGERQGDHRPEGIFQLQETE